MSIVSLSKRISNNNQKHPLQKSTSYSNKLNNMNLKLLSKLAGIFSMVSLLLFAFNANAQSGYELKFVKANSQYITVPHSSSLNLTTSFTMEAFVNVNGGINNTIIDKGNYDYLWQLNANGNGN